MPVLEQLLVIPQPHIHTDVDFSSGETRSAGEVGISARVGTLLGVGTCAADPGAAVVSGLSEETTVNRKG